MNKEEIKKDLVNNCCDVFCTKRIHRETEDMSIITSKILDKKLAENNELSLTNEEIKCVKETFSYDDLFPFLELELTETVNSNIKLYQSQSSEYDFDSTYRLEDSDDCPPTKLDCLGCYISPKDQETPSEIHLFMDNIDDYSKAHHVNRKYVVMAVYLHEIGHALFDRNPCPKHKDEKLYEEPLAELFALTFINMRAKSCEIWKEILSAAYNLCYIKRFYKSIKFYSLGADLFNNYQEEDCALFLERYYYNKMHINNVVDVTEYRSNLISNKPSRECLKVLLSIINI